jgi:hypothetical protein
MNNAMLWTDRVGKAFGYEKEEGGIAKPSGSAEKTNKQHHLVAFLVDMWLFSFRRKLD